VSRLILALDCSLRWTAVSVFSEEGVLTEERIDAKRRQATELPLAVERALTKTGRSFGDISLLAVTNGPGYFTGVRVGAAYAAALAYGLGVKIAPVSTLYMLAWPRAGRSLPVLAAAYAGRGCVYAASFGCGEDLSQGEYKKDGLEAWLVRHGDAVILSDDPPKIVETLPFLGSREIQLSLPDASAVAKIAWSARKTAIDPMELRVFYHRAPQVG
jgi:tRNA threonylcarbamoyladenosine biosynthesis protein TsaB